MNDPEYLSPEQEQQLLDCYRALWELMDSCAVPAVRTAARVAVAELHAAIDGQALGIDFYSHRLPGYPGAVQDDQAA